jgi:parallel beta-helix repeat protein
MCKYLDHLEKVLGGTYLVISIKLFLIIIVAIIFLSLEPSTGKDQPCIMMYTFENASLTPSDNVINNGWQPDEQSHSGKRSFASTRKGVNKFRMINVSGPAYITFWWKSDIHKVKNFFLFQVDKKTDVTTYESNGKWEKVNYTLQDIGPHVLTWTFDRNTDDDISGRIDDLCIRKSTCDDECTDNLETEIPGINPPTNNTNPSNFTKSENFTRIANTTVSNITEKYLPREVTKKRTVVYVISGDRNGDPVFPTIQSAINNVQSGATIHVISQNHQSYNEDVIINKSIKLIGDGFATIKPSKIGIHVEADDVVVNGFIIDGGDDGVQLDNSRCNISENLIQHNKVGIFINDAKDSQISRNQLVRVFSFSLELIHSINITINNNSISNSKENGVYLVCADKNKITNNTIEDVYGEGIYLNTSDDNTISNNEFKRISKCKIFEYNCENKNIDLTGTNWSCSDTTAICRCYGGFGR